MAKLLLQGPRLATHDLQASGRATRKFCGIAGIIMVWADAVVVSQVRSDTRAASGLDTPHRERLTMPDHVCKADRIRGSTDDRRKRVRAIAYVKFARAKLLVFWRGGDRGLESQHSAIAWHDVMRHHLNFSTLSTKAQAVLLSF